MIRAAQRRAQLLEKDPNRDFFVWWDDIKKADILSFEKVLDSARGENSLQSYLQKKPILLIQHLGGGHGRWVIPKQRLGSEFVTDFIIGNSYSDGYEWEAVELESPLSPMFTKSGNPSRQLTHAIRQIQDWRAWLNINQNYAARPRHESGLGLTDIVPSLHGLILIGRRSSTSPSSNERRRQMIRDLNIEIHSYDFLLSSAGSRLEALRCRL